MWTKVLILQHNHSPTCCWFFHVCKCSCYMELLFFAFSFFCLCWIKVFCVILFLNCGSSGSAPLLVLPTTNPRIKALDLFWMIQVASSITGSYCAFILTWLMVSLPLHGSLQFMPQKCWREAWCVTSLSKNSIHHMTSVVHLDLHG